MVRARRQEDEVAGRVGEGMESVPKVPLVPYTQTAWASLRLSSSLFVLLSSKLCSLTTTVIENDNHEKPFLSRIL